MKTSKLCCWSSFCFFVLSNLQVIHGQPSPNCSPSFKSLELDLNNVRTPISVSGYLWNRVRFEEEIVTDRFYEVPKNSGLSSLGTGGLYFGAYDDLGNLKVAAHSYRVYTEINDFWPGPLDENGQVTQETCNNFDRLWKVNRSTIDSFKAGLFSQIPESILDWPGRNNPFLPFETNQDLAPFVDVNNDNTYNPSDGDYPKILGDQSIWQIFNDVGNEKTVTQAEAVHLQIALEAYAFNSIEGFENHTFYRYKIINKSDKFLQQARLGLWIDPDIGQFDDDYMGCDSTRNMAIAYNGDDFDNQYGATPPMVGIKILQAPTQPNGEPAKLTVCRPYRYGQEDFPRFGAEYMYVLQARLRDSSLVSTDGREVFYAFPEDPAFPEESPANSECSDNNFPSERQFIMGTDKFEMQPNAVQEVHFAVLWTRDNLQYPCPSFEPIQQIADEVQDWFDNNDLISGLQFPIRDQEIQLLQNPMRIYSVLSWGRSAIQIQEVNLYHTNGQLVRNYLIEDAAQKSLQIFRKDLAQGLYLVELKTVDGLRKTQKLIVP